MGITGLHSFHKDHTSTSWRVATREWHSHPSSSSSRPLPPSSLPSSSSQDPLPPRLSRRRFSDLSLASISEPPTLVSVSSKRAVSKSSQTTKVTVSPHPTSVSPPVPASVSSEMPPRTKLPRTQRTPSLMPSV